MSTMNPEEVSSSVSRLLTSLTQGHQSGFQSKAGLPVLGRSPGISTASTRLCGLESMIPTSRKCERASALALCLPGLYWICRSCSLSIYL